MKTRRRELAKPGIYGTVDDPKIVSKKNLLEIVETFPDIKKAPVSLNGHWPDPAKPRLGNVVSVEFDEATQALVGDVEEDDVLASAVDEGFYPDVSIGGKLRASDGKMYLHHLAYLGEEPPAIKDLVSDILKGLSGSEPSPDTMEAPAEIAASDSPIVDALPSPSSRRLLLSDPTATITDSNIQPGVAGKTPVKEESMDPIEEVIAGITDEAKKKAAGDAYAALKAQAAAAVKDKAKLAELAKKYPDEGIELSDHADPRVDGLVRQLRDGKKAEILRACTGKVPKAKQTLVTALADSFSTGDTIELSDGEAKTHTSQFDLLTRILGEIPKPVHAGVLDLSDGDDGSKPADLSKLKGKI